MISLSRKRADLEVPATAGLRRAADGLAAVDGSGAR